jgi:putative glutathione S-transferase
MPDNAAEVARAAANALVAGSAVFKDRTPHPIMQISRPSAKRGARPRGGCIMAMLVDGEWRDEDPVNEIGKAGNFQRVDSVFRDRITADGSSGFPAEAGRYHLYASYGCPWAHRTLIYLALKKLTGVISVAIAAPSLPKQGWMFEDNPAFPDCTPDRVNGFRYLHQAYAASNPHYTGKVTVPTLWDKKTRRIVNNESSEIIRMFNSEFGALGAEPTDFYPKHLRAEIDRINEQVYANVNNGAYRCGFARSQAAYDEAYDALFATLDEIEARLGRQRYLVGNQITEADWRLFPTLARFDVAYFSLFKCNRNRIADFPNLLNYLRELYAVPGVAETVKPRYYVMGYYSIKRVNPTGIIPKGTPVDFKKPHDRARIAA